MLPWKHFPSAISSDDSNRYYNALIKMVDKTPAKLVIYGKECTEPRLTKAFARKAGSMKYSGTEKEFDGEWPSIIEEIHTIACKITDNKYTWDTVLINYYRDGNDYISYHSDKDGAGYPIMSFSFGAERPFFIKSKQEDTKYEILLKNGSAIFMMPTMQDDYKHSLPKRKKIKTGRINITFRNHGRELTDSQLTIQS